MESTDYDLFDYRHHDEAGVPLDEAIKKAAELRSSDAIHFYRIVPTDSSMTAFRVQAFPRSDLYNELLTRWSALFNKFTLKSMKR